MRAWEAAELTIPSLLPRQGKNGSSPLPQPYQSVGAKGVNNLAAKALLALFPPGSSFFRLSADELVLMEMAKKADSPDEASDFRTKMDAALARVERSVLTRMEQSGLRSPLYDTLQHLIVAGNVLIEMLPGGKLKNHYLNSYVVKRDPEGQVIEIVVLERYSKATLPEAARSIVENANTEDPNNKSAEDIIDVYTHIQLVTEPARMWRQYQEVCGLRIPDTTGFYRMDKLPWVALRFSSIDGEDYGRGHVEQYSGDLRSLESLSQSLVEFAGISANIKFLIRPGSNIDPSRLTKAPNGSFHKGEAKDITVVGLEKFADFRVTKEMADKLEQRLGEAFLIGSAMRRDAERVTAEEIRLIAAELEQNLGGFYSLLAQELQLPLVTLLLNVLQKEKKLPALPKDTVKPSIVTGMEALGRNGDLVKIRSLLEMIAVAFGPQAVQQFMKPDWVIQRSADALGYDVTGGVYTQEELKQKEQQAAAQEMVHKLGPQMLKNAQEQQSADPSAQPQETA